MCRGKPLSLAKIWVFSSPQTLRFWWQVVAEGFKNVDFLGSSQITRSQENIVLDE
jgi:hypothetical protein